MNIEELREYCLSLPHATEDVKWKKDLCFSVGGKMFCVCGLEPADNWQYSFKCTPEAFAELVEIPGIVPAPYAARYHWVAVEKQDVLDHNRIRSLIDESYRLVFDKLPLKVRIALR